MKANQVGYLGIGLALVTLLGSCATPENVALPGEGATSSYAEAPPGRPGLGTKWGEDRRSAATEVAFIRANPARPVAMAKIFYNDRAGIEAMASTSLARSQWSTSPSVGSGLISIALRDRYHRLLPGLNIGDRWFVVGEEGNRYSIVVRNLSDFRLETVISVDGLDVLDGRPASLRKRGYVIAPRRTLVVDGFRQSLDKVAVFRFGPVRESYSQEKYHTTRNVGVIGIGVFGEKGHGPLDEQEIDRRLQANPFPRFATPPNE